MCDQQLAFFGTTTTLQGKSQLTRLSNNLFTFYSKASLFTEVNYATREVGDTTFAIVLRLSIEFLIMIGLMKVNIYSAVSGISYVASLMKCFQFTEQNRSIFV